MRELIDCARLDCVAASSAAPISNSVFALIWNLLYAIMHTTLDNVNTNRMKDHLEQLNLLGRDMKAIAISITLLKTEVKHVSAMKWPIVMYFVNVKISTC